MILTGQEVALSGGGVSTEHDSALWGPANQPLSPSLSILVPSVPFTFALTALLTQGY